MGGAAAYSDNDLIIYDTNFFQTMVFKNYLNAPNHTFIPGTTIYSRDGAVWKRKDNIFYLYIKGVLQVSDMVTAQYSITSASDLEVTEVASGNIWILEDYVNRNDNTLRPARRKE